MIKGDELSMLFNNLAARKPLPAVAANIESDLHLNPDLSHKLKTLEKRPAAVLIPILEKDGTFSVLLTERAGHLSHHAGQVSFPGGKVEPQDNDTLSTALRETQEEIGIESGYIDILGKLARYQTGTGFLIEPYLGVVRSQHELVIDPSEVASVFDVPLAHVVSKQNYVKESRNFAGVERHFYRLTHEDHYIWGATAAILVNLCDVLLHYVREESF